MNNTMLVGRVTTTPNLDYTETNQKYTKITLAVNRAYKNAEGIYETDFIPILLFDQIAENVSEYVKAGDLVGVKGRLETRYTDTNEKYLVVIPDRITYLSSNTNTTDQYTQDDTNNMITPNETNETNPLNEGEI